MSANSKVNPPQNPPPVQRLRLRYAKRGRARFTSHMDFARAFERAVRRAGVPLSLSSGFHQHPRISYANATPTGAATEADYLEIAMAEAWEPARVVEKLNEALPLGMVILDAREASEGKLTDQLTASRWRIELRSTPADVVERAVLATQGASELIVSRQVKDGLRTFDCLPALAGLRVSAPSELDAVLIHFSPLVRPDDLVAGLRVVEPGIQEAPGLFTRTAQGVWEGARIVGPFGN